MEENISNIEEYRKKRKKKKRRKRLIAFLVIFLLLAAAAVTGWFFTRSNWNGGGSDTEDTASVDTGIRANGYPIAVGGSSPLDIRLCGKSIFLLTKNSIVAFNDKGKEIYNAHHGYSNPVIAVSSKRVLTYDRGGYQFRVDSNKSRMGSKELSEKIVCGAVSSAGYAAVVTQTERYTIRLTVYDAAMQELLNWSVSDQVITGVSFNEESSACVVSAYSVENGRTGSVVYELGLKDEEPERFRTRLEDCMVLSAAYKAGGNIGIVTDKKTFVLDSRGEIREEWEYTGELTSFDNRSESGILVFLADAGDIDNTLIWLIDADGSRSAGDISSRVVDSCAGDQRVLVLTEKELLVFDRKLEQKKAEALEGVPIRADCSKSEAYVLTAGELVQISVS